MLMNRRRMLAFSLATVATTLTGCKSTTTTIVFQNKTGAPLSVNAFVTAKGKTYRFKKNKIANGKSAKQKYVTQLNKNTQLWVNGTLNVGGMNVDIPADTVPVIIAQTNTYVIFADHADFYLNGVFQGTINF